MVIEPLFALMVCLPHHHALKYWALMGACAFHLGISATTELVIANVGTLAFGALVFHGEHDRLRASFLTGLRCSHRWRCAEELASYVGAPTGGREAEKQREEERRVVRPGDGNFYGNVAAGVGCGEHNRL